MTQKPASTPRGEGYILLSTVTVTSVLCNVPSHPDTASSWTWPVLLGRVSGVLGLQEFISFLSLVSPHFLGTLTHHIVRLHLQLPGQGVRCRDAESPHVSSTVWD